MTHTLSPSQSEQLDITPADGDLCGAELTTGGTCDRLESECPYDSHREA